MAIPHIIHYCWFGHGEKPEVFDKCLESWKKYFQGFEIKEWNEENTDLSFSLFAQKAYEAKKYAFVSDVVRLKVIYEWGGIYLDTDVEVKNSFEECLKYDGFFFFQNHSQINTGMGFGAEQNHELVKKMLESYKFKEFDAKDMLNLACPPINTESISGVVKEFIRDGKTQLHENTAFISAEKYWQLAHHYGEFSWKSDGQRLALKYAKKKHSMIKFRKIIRNPNIFYFLESHSLSFGAKVYKFLVYDFIDYGCLYWLIRLGQKIMRRDT